MKSLLSLIILLASIQVSANSVAFFDDGNSLVDKIKEYKKAVNSDGSANYKKATEFRGYIVGIHDALSANSQICTNNVTKNQIGAVVSKFMSDNPARWNEPAYYLVEEAIKEAFPCKR